MSGFVLYRNSRRLLKRNVRSSKVSKHGRSVVLRPRYKTIVHTSSVLGHIQKADSTIMHVLGFFAIVISLLIIGIMIQSKETVEAQTDSLKTYSNYSEIEQFPQHNLQQKNLKVYTVQSGDTVVSICSKLEVDCDVMKSINRLEYPYLLRSGMQLKYPA